MSGIGDGSSTLSGIGRLNALRIGIVLLRTGRVANTRLFDTRDYIIVKPKTWNTGQRIQIASSIRAGEILIEGANPLAMDAFNLYALATTAWLTLQAVPLLLRTHSTLRLALSGHQVVSDLEVLLARSSAIVLIIAAVVSIFSSGIISFPNLSSLAIRRKMEPGRPGSAPAAPISYEQRTLLLATTIPVHVLLSAIYYVNYVIPGNSTLALWIAMFCSTSLAAMGGGLYLFGSGSGSDRKMRSHIMFDSPEHRREVSERHAARRSR